MSFDSYDFLCLAYQLVGKPQTAPCEEACLRSAVSRAYYAVFWQARSVAQARPGFELPRKNPHAALINWFKREPGTAYRKVGTDLERLRDDRNKADYDLLVPGLASLTETALSTAERTISTIRSVS
jgi:uncharacterized protein (UPF0332 family)